ERAPPRGGVKESAKAAVLALAVSLLLVVCFSPSLITIHAFARVPELFSQSVPVRRGVWVTAQVADPFIEIGDSVHKIVRWRLLMPMIGHWTGLPAGMVLALA